jgi:hypothetical protein
LPTHLIGCISGLGVFANCVEGESSGEFFAAIFDGLNGATGVSVAL